MSQQEIIKEQYEIFTKRFHLLVRYQKTPLAEFDCELCGCRTKLGAFTAFMYPDFSIKAMCNPCGRKETLRLDYRNKN